MATIDWPDDLPQVFLRDSYTEGLPQNTIRDQFDVGPATVRRRSTAASFPIGGDMILTGTEWTALVAFFADVLLQGSLAFGIREQDDCDSPYGEWLVRFIEPPTRQRMGEDWRVSIKLEVLP